MESGRKKQRFIKDEGRVTKSEKLVIEKSGVKIDTKLVFIY